MAFSADWIIPAVGTWLVVEIVKKIADHRWARGLREDEREWLKDLHEVHKEARESMAEVDRIARDQIELRNAMTQLALTLKEITLINHQMLKLLERLESRLS